jgi:Tir chaperone protein (CesT) family
MGDESRTPTSFVSNGDSSPLFEKERSGKSTTKKNRAVINRYLSYIGKQLVLDDDGLCTFQCGIFLMVIEVPWDSNTFLLYTSIMKCHPSSTAVLRKALELNYTIRDANCCTLSLVPSRTGNSMEINLCRSQRIDGVNPSNVVAMVGAFLMTATSVQNQLHRAQRTKRTLIPPSLPRRHKSNAGNQGRKPRQHQKPPPPPCGGDMTPTISNKAADKEVDNDAELPRNVVGRSPKRPVVQDLAKVNLALSWAVAASTACSYSSKSAPRSSSVLRRLIPMASKTFTRPLASFRNERPWQPMPINEI